MGYTKEKVAYLRGLADGLQLGDDMNGKLFKAIIETLDDMASAIDENEEAIIDLDESIDELCDEISDLDDVLDALIDADEDDDDDYEDEDFVEVECEGCGETIYFDQDMLESDDELICPNCNHSIIPAWKEEDAE